MCGIVFKRRNTLQMHGLHYYVRVFSEENTIICRSQQEYFFHVKLWGHIETSFEFSFSSLGLYDLLHGLDDGGGADAELVDKNLGGKYALSFFPQHCSQTIVFLFRMSNGYRKLLTISKKITF